MPDLSTATVAYVHPQPAQPIVVGDVDPAKNGQNRRMPIGHRLRRLRTEAGLSQPELAALTRQIAIAETGDPDANGVGTFTITRQEGDQHHPKPRTVRLLAKALTAALNRRITQSYLSGSDTPGEALVTHLERERARRKATREQFYAGLLGITDADLERLKLGQVVDGSGVLGKIVRKLPELQTFVVDLIAADEKQPPLVSPT